MSGAPSDRIAPAGSMADLLGLLLAETPGVRDAARQQALTDRFLGPPTLATLEALCLHLRGEVDPILRHARPGPAHAPYPLGQCLGITKAVQRRLSGPEPLGLAGAAAAGWAALREFLEAGGELRRAWGDLRGQYFQNALIVGGLYVDVSNDSVVATRPKVEILPFGAAGFTAITDYGHYARIARRYWRQTILPNHVLPELAPWLPLIQIAADGRPRLGPSTRYMLGMTLAGRFAPSERVLEAPALTAAIFPTLSAGLGAGRGGGPMAVAANAEAGREAALDHCRRCRDDGPIDGAAALARALAAGAEANRRLAALTVIPQAA